MPHRLKLTTVNVNISFKNKKNNKEICWKINLKKNARTSSIN
jgi:hypothetical protein